MNYLFRLVRRAVIVVGILFTGLGLGSGFAPAAEAALDGCRSDPVIYLSDGTALDLSVDIGTPVSNVATIQYFVHVPRGLHMLLYVATPTIGFQGKESFTMLYDAPAAQYSTDTLVQTRIRGVSMTSHTTLVGVYLWSLGLSLQAKPASGFNGQHLWTTLYR